MVYFDGLGGGGGNVNKKNPHVDRLISLNGGEGSDDFKIKEEPAHTVGESFHISKMSNFSWWNPASLWANFTGHSGGGTVGKVTEHTEPVRHHLDREG